jgi:hypothetical protein
MNNRRPFRQREQTKKLSIALVAGKRNSQKDEFFHMEKVGGLTIVHMFVKSAKRELQF